MRTKTIQILALLGASGWIWTTACTNSTSVASEKKQLDSVSLVKRGEYLVATSGCDDCHSPKRMGPRGPELIPELRLSGHPSSQPLPPIDTTEISKGWVLFGPGNTACVGPWGTSYSGNLTSDESGIGNWTEEQFFTCIRKGKYKGMEGSRPLLPPMPWPIMAQMTDEDLRSIFYYLKTTKPVKNVVPAAAPLHP